MLFKNKIIHLLAALIAMGVLATACESSLEGLNDNPNAPTEVPSELILPQTQERALNRLYSMSGLNGYVGAIWAQSYAKIQYTEEDRYDFSGRVNLINDLWESFYSTSLKDLYAIRDKAEAAGNANQQAIAEIMIAWNYQVMTDLWGSIPYTEAVQGLAENSENRIINPAYDPQEEIYAGLLSTLESAANRIDVNSSPYGSEDLIYGGDMMKWKKFANSLRLRILMRMSEVDPGTASSGISEIISSGAPIMTSHADNAKVEYMAYPNNNPVNEFARTRVDHKVSSTTLSWLAQLDDPRMRVYAVPMQNQNPETVVTEIYTDDRGYNYQGVRNGSEDNSIELPNASTMGHYFMAPSSPGRIMTYNEVLFIRAEAAARGWTGENAQTLYQDAIRASMNLYTQGRLDAVLSGFAGGVAFNHQGFTTAEYPSGITEEEINNYLSQPEVQWNAGAGWSESNKQKLAVQKWLSLYSQGLETWFEWRRLGYPELEPGPEAVLDAVPKRLSYPATEQSLNNSNRLDAVERQGEDNLLTRVWWDMN